MLCVYYNDYSLIKQLNFLVDYSTVLTIKAEGIFFFFFLSFIGPYKEGVIISYLLLGS